MEITKRLERLPPVFDHRNVFCMFWIALIYFDEFRNTDNPYKNLWGEPLQKSSETRTEIRTQICMEIRTEIRTDGKMGNNIIPTDCHLIRISCSAGVRQRKIVLGSGISILFLKGSSHAVLYLYDGWPDPLWVL